MVEHAYPTGLPMPSVGITNSGPGDISVFITGYLIDASALPAQGASTPGATAKALSLG
jgi:hypothetical protein